MVHLLSEFGRFFTLLTLLLVLAGICVGALWHLESDKVLTLIQSVDVIANIATVIGVAVAVKALGIWRAQHKFTDKYQNIVELKEKGRDVFELLIEFTSYCGTTYCFDIAERNPSKLFTSRSRYAVVVFRFSEQILTAKNTLASEQYNFGNLFTVANEAERLMKKAEKLGDAEYEWLKINKSWKPGDELSDLLGEILRAEQTFNDEINLLRLNIPAN